MPRTKRPVRKPERFLDNGETQGEALKKLDKIVAEEKKKLDMRLEMELRNIELAFKIFTNSIPKQYLQMTVGQLRNELYLQEITNTRAASHDEGYLTENSSHGSGERHKKVMAPLSTTRKPTRRSRSADASRAASRADTAHTMTSRRRSRSVYRTPAYNKNSVNAYPAITPKVAPHTPLTLLRQPRQGEMVVSMTGSPVMVPSYSSMQPDEKANCNILLKDGTMLSLQPKQLRQSQAYIPFSLMDSGVLAQLKTLKENIDKVVKMGENIQK